MFKLQIQTFGCECLNLTLSFFSVGILLNTKKLIYQIYYCTLTYNAEPNHIFKEHESSSKQANLKLS